MWINRSDLGGDNVPASQHQLHPCPRAWHRPGYRRGHLGRKDRSRPHPGMIELAITRVPVLEGETYIAVDTSIGAIHLAAAVADSLGL